MTLNKRNSYMVNSLLNLRKSHVISKLSHCAPVSPTQLQIVMMISLWTLMMMVMLILMCSLWLKSFIYIFLDNMENYKRRDNLIINGLPLLSAAEAASTPGAERQPTDEHAASTEKSSAGIMPTPTRSVNLRI